MLTYLLRPVASYGVVIVIVSVALCSMSAFAAEIHVPSQTTSIQFAIQAALDGDTIIVAPDSENGGPYQETLDLMGKEITLRSSHGAQHTTIDGGQQRSVIWCISGETSTTVIEGFTVTGGNATDAIPNDRGGAIYIQGSSPVIRSCILVDNRATFGGAVYSNVGNARFENCVLRNNLAISRGGAAYMNESSAVFIDCRFLGNEAKSHSGAIYHRDETLVLERCRFRGNASGWYGGAISVGAAATVQATSCEFYGNTAVTDGGAMRVDGLLFLGHCTVAGNEAPAGPGFLTRAGSTMSVTGCIIWQPAGAIDGDGFVAVDFSNVSGGASGSGNLDEDPSFVDLANGDLRLRPGSPCIDASTTNAFLTFAEPLDAAGNPRVVDQPLVPNTGITRLGVTPDMGALERPFDPCELENQFGR